MGPSHCVVPNVFSKTLKVLSLSTEIVLCCLVNSNERQPMPSVYLLRPRRAVARR